MTGLLGVEVGLSDALGMIEGAFFGTTVGDAVGEGVGRDDGVGLDDGEVVGYRDVCDPLDNPRNTSLNAVKLTCIFNSEYHHLIAYCK